MYEVIKFKSEPRFTKLACLDELAEFLNGLGNIAVADIEKEWNIISEYHCSLECTILYYDLSKEE